MRGRQPDGVRAAVVGHVEWVEFAPVAAVPAAGEIVHADRPWEEPAGGGAVAAVALARLAGGCLLLTALGDDELAARTVEMLADRDVEVHAARRAVTRRALTLLDASGERTIVTLGERLEPLASDPLPWDALASADAVYFTAGDVAALEAARAARVLVATPRARGALRAANVQLDALVGSGTDPGELYRRGTIDPEPSMVVRTLGDRGGEYLTREGRAGRWGAAPLPGPVADAYGCGDSFAAGLAFALADGRDADAALAFAARCGAACLTGNGPYGADLPEP
jgi:ribokinase